MIWDITLDRRSSVEQFFVCLYLVIEVHLFSSIYQARRENSSWVEKTVHGCLSINKVNVIYSMSVNQLKLEINEQSMK